MGGRIFTSDFVKRVFLSRLRRESFIVLDIGTFSVKALIVESEKKGGVGRITAASSRYHVDSDMNADGTFNIGGIIATSRAAINELRRLAGAGTKAVKDVIIGIGGSFVLGKTLSQTYIRENPQEEIDERELSNIIQKIQQRNYDQIRREFRKETGKSELEVRIISASVLEIKIDGYEVSNPVGFKGKEISCAVFTSYLSKSHYRIFEELISALGLRLLYTASEPYAVFRGILKKNPSLGDFILIDIGGSTTEISLARKNKLEDVRSITLGGSSFTRSIAEHLKIGFWEAENIKRKFAKGDVSSRVAKSIEEILARDAELLLRGIELVLTDMSQVSLLPPSIYLYGGGSTLPVLLKMLGKKDWRESLSFFSRPVLLNAPIPDIQYSEKSLSDAQWVISLFIAESYFAEGGRDDELSKIMKRSVRLIQG